MKPSRKSPPITAIACIACMFSNLEATVPVLPDDSGTDGSGSTPSVSVVQRIENDIASVAESTVQGVGINVTSIVKAAFEDVAQQVEPDVLPASLALAADVFQGNNPAAEALAVQDLGNVMNMFITALEVESGKALAADVASNAGPIITPSAAT